ncbi:MAG: transferrin-binding protein-like solute binding protein [Synechococcus sp. SB0678_bin_12]|nr:transferrin-binding protein-like solute binding protein [Synechococcus sp. SB0678_bin_12]
MGLPNLTLESSCVGTSCTLTENQFSNSTILVPLGRISIADPDVGKSELLGTKHGITLIQQLDGQIGEVTDVNSLGAWMQHSFFATETFDGADFKGYLGVAGGDLTRSRPRGNATWHGLMVGTSTGDNELLQGDATLMYSLDDQRLDASFTNIQNLDSEPHSVTSVGFTDVPVDARGEFKTGSTGNRIQGGFYGPDHAETAGTFEKSNIVGAFGAKREE